MSAKQHVPSRKGLDEWSLREQRSCREHHEATKTRRNYRRRGLNAAWTGVLIMRIISDI